MDEEQLLYALALQQVEGVGDVIYKKLVGVFGSPKAVLAASKSQLIQVNRIGDLLIQNLANTNIYVKAEKELKQIQKHQIEVAFYRDSNYPPLLAHCADGPVLLFSTCSIDWSNPRIISVVGTRSATLAGIQFCRKFIKDLAHYKPLIVSGFAHGVDIEAHLAAIHNNLQTVAVLGHGLCSLYPKDHLVYRDAIRAQGGFVTEFWTGSPADKENFIRRNRIVAGLSQATVVVESAFRGGALSTASFANDYHREVFAVPGRITDKFSRGCNNLIKNQKAQLIESAVDVIEMLQWDRDKPVADGVQKQFFVALNSEEECIYKLLEESGQQLLDQIAQNCNLSVFKVSAHLLNMELRGVVRQLPGKRYELL